MGKLPLSILKAIGIVAIVAWSILPIALIVLSSFKSDRDIFSPSARFSFMPTLANYQLLWSRWGDFFHGLWNSFLVTLGAPSDARPYPSLARSGKRRGFAAQLLDEERGLR